MVSSSTNAENPLNQIASLLSGDAPQKKEETPEAVKTQEETLEDLDESQPQEESLAPEVEEESAESSEDVEGNIDTINNLAEELELPVEDMYALNVKLSRGENLPDGGAITLGELKSFYEKNADIDTLREDIKQRETDLQSQSETFSEAPQVSNELLQARAHVLAIQDQYNRTDWQGLRHTNPAEYSALQNDFRMQFENAKANEQTVMNTVETHIVESQRQAQERLFEAMPELREKEVRDQVGRDVSALAAKYKFTDKDVGGITNPNLMRMLIDFSRTDKAKVTAKAKKVESIPTATKASSSRPIPGRKAALKRLTEKAKASGQLKDQATAVAELLRG